MSVILTAVVRQHSLKTGFVSHPRKARFSTRTVALGGGIAIFANFFLIMSAALLAAHFLLRTGKLDFLGQSVMIHKAGFLEKLPQLIIVLACLVLLFAVGLYDDKKNLGPWMKLLFQFAVAFIAAFLADIRVELFIESRLVTSILSAFWIVFLINAFNFLDNMDGVSAGIAAIASVILLTSAILNGQVFVGSLAIIFIGTLLGFLVFNFPPAKIFMGDAGSLIVGFIMATLTLKITYYQQAESGRWYSVLMPLITMAVPLYDFTSVTFLRISQGKSPFVGDTQHFSHRMKRHGLSDTQVALTLYIATLCTGLGAVFLYQVNILGALLVFAQTVLILFIIAIFESTVRDGAGNPKT